ncbi:MAG: DNA polymerase III subunit [Clostridia bacterium]|nr:DNA polymerase III subunit [Clostridia bacterium]
MIFPIENSRIKTSVQSFIASERIPHAIMIEGENTTSNLELALYIATAAVCEESLKPCGTCRHCHLAEVGSHPDIARITTLEGKKNLSVDQIRELRAEAFVKPHSASRRIFIIEDASKMNPQAQNALLKVLEEPPKNVVFILLVPSKTMLLDTIISRCVLLSLLNTKCDENAHIDSANKFIDLLLTGSEYEMLALLTPLEKNRSEAEAFFKTLSLCVADKLKKGTGHARALDKLFNDIKYYLDLLATNINLSLLFSIAVSRSKGLLDK